MSTTLLGPITIPSLDELSAAAQRRARALRAVGRDAYLASLGAAATAQDGARKAYDALAERTERQFDALVRRGDEADATRANAIRRVRDDVTRRTDAAAARIDASVLRPARRATSALVRRAGLPAREEVLDLAASVSELSRKVDALVARLDATPVIAAEPTIAVRATDDGWVIEMEGMPSPLGVHATKDDAVETARALAADRAPSHLIVYKKDGTIQDTVSYHA